MTEAALPPAPGEGGPPSVAPTIPQSGRKFNTQGLVVSIVTTALAFFVGGLVVTVASSVVLARELDRIGERLGFSEALLGIVTALGADGPEIASAVAALVSAAPAGRLVAQEKKDDFVSRAKQATPDSRWPSGTA